MAIRKTPPPSAPAISSAEKPKMHVSSTIYVYRTAAAVEAGSGGEVAYCRPKELRFFLMKSSNRRFISSAPTDGSRALGVRGGRCCGGDCCAGGGAAGRVFCMMAFHVASRSSSPSASTACDGSEGSRSRWTARSCAGARLRRTSAK